MPFSQGCHITILVSQSFVHPVPVCFTVKSTGVAPGPAVSKGEEVMCSKPGDTEGDGRDLAANKAGNRVVLPGVIRLVQSSCRSKSHQTELGEVPRQLFPSKGTSVKLISVQDGLSKGTVPSAQPQDTTATGRSRPQPYTNPE